MSHPIDDLEREFRPRGLYPDENGVLYLPVPAAIEFLERADELDIAVTSAESFIFQPGKLMSLSTPYDFWPNASSWSEFRRLANREAVACVKAPKQPHIPNVWTFDCWAETEWRERMKP